MLGLRLLLPPDHEPVSLEMARLHCRVDRNDDDVLLEAYISAAREVVEDLTGRALITQTWEATFRLRGCESVIWLPRQPVQAILSVGTLDADGLAGVLLPGDYRAMSAGTLGPVGAWSEETVVVTYRAGYGPPDSVPKSLIAAILLGVGDLYEHREASVERALTANPAFMRLVNLHRLILP